jgi:hypothetical protein
VLLLTRQNLGVKSHGTREDIVREDFVRITAPTTELVRTTTIASVSLVWMANLSGLAQIVP